MRRSDPRALLGGTALLWLALTGVTGAAASAAWAVGGSGPTTGVAGPLPAKAGPVTVAKGACSLLSITITLTWPAVDGATEYVVSRSDGSTTTTSATSITETALLASLTTYTVRARVGSWQGAASDPVSSPSNC